MRTFVALALSLTSLTPALAAKPITQAARQAAKALPTAPYDIKVRALSDTVATIQVREYTPSCKGCEGVYVAVKQPGGMKLKKVVADGAYKTSLTDDFHTAKGSEWGVTWNKGTIVQRGVGGAERHLTVNSDFQLKALGPAFRVIKLTSFDGKSSREIKLTLDN